MDIILRASVDEDLVKKVSGIDDIEEAIMFECNWIHQSGIIVNDVREVQEAM